VSAAVVRARASLERATEAAVAASWFAAGMGKVLAASAAVVVIWETYRAWSFIDQHKLFVRSLLQLVAMECLQFFFLYVLYLFSVLFSSVISPVFCLCVSLSRRLLSLIRRIALLGAGAKVKVVVMATLVLMIGTGITFFDSPEKHVTNAEVKITKSSSLYPVSFFPSNEVFAANGSSISFSFSNSVNSTERVKCPDNKCLVPRKESEGVLAIILPGEQPAELAKFYRVASALFIAALQLLWLTPLQFEGLRF
jgi:hypothetical protein